MSKRSKSKSVSSNPLFPVLAAMIPILMATLQWFASFISDNPTTVVGMNGREVNSYLFFNIANLISIVSFCVFLYMIYIYFAGKNAPAEIIFRAGRWSDKYIKIAIRNDEPVAVADLSAKIIAFSYNHIISNDLYSGYILKTSFPERVITQDEFIFGQVNQDSYLQIKFHDFSFSQPLGNPKRKDERNTAKCKVVIEFFGRLEDEKETISLGQYYIEILQERWFDDSAFENAIGFEEFRLLSKEEKKAPKDLVSAQGKVGVRER